MALSPFLQANMHSGHGFAYDTMRRAEVYSRHHPLEAAAAGQDSLSLQHSLTSSTNLDHQVKFYKWNVSLCKLRLTTKQSSLNNHRLSPQLIFVKNLLLPK